MKCYIFKDNTEICGTILRKVKGIYGTQYIIRCQSGDYFLPHHVTLNELLFDKVGTKVIIKCTKAGNRYSAFKYEVIRAYTNLDDFF